MDTKDGLNRETKYALMSAAAAGIVSFILIVAFIDMLTLPFIPVVMMMVFVSAYFAFKRQTRNEGSLTGRRVFLIALEVGTVSHFYTFAVYTPLAYLALGNSQIDSDAFLAYILWTLFASAISLVMFVWIAVPMYVGVGYILKSSENQENEKKKTANESILDDDLLTVE